MDEHFEAFVHPHIEVYAFEDGFFLTFAQPPDGHGEGLFVLLGIEDAEGEFAADAFWEHVVEGAAVAVLFDIDGVHVELGLGVAGDGVIVREVLGEAAPLVAHKFQAGKAEGGLFLEAVHVHADEAYGAEVADTSYRHFVGAVEGHAEAVPNPSVGCFESVGDEGGAVDINFARVIGIGAQGDFVLEIVFCFVEGIIAIEVLCVGYVGGRIEFVGTGVGAGVAFRVGKEAVSVDDTIFRFESSVVVNASVLVIVPSGFAPSKAKAAV